MSERSVPAPESTVDRGWTSAVQAEFACLKNLMAQSEQVERRRARAVLGTVPVESDGSAHFSLPAGIPVYFQVLDECGLAI